MSSSRGFTLIELSIVLVIIGLLVGGVLMGRDLIRAAEVRATVTQIEKYNTAVNTFRIKYNGLPGDLTTATTFGFAVNGNGDGCITDCTAPLTYYLLASPFDTGSATGRLDETSAFWNQLAQAGLIEGHYDGATTIDSNSIGKTFPALKLNSTIGVLAYYDTGPHSANYFQMVLYNSDNSLGPTTGVNNAVMPPATAYAIDKKVDDGFPDRGNIQSIDSGQDGFLTEVYDASNQGLYPALPLTYPLCAYVPAGTFNYIYNLSDNTVPCLLQFKFM